ncbi:MAG TPA: membrane protein insertion efficiency factor YidD [Candidatus Limnocylindrales bacterium]
MLLEPPFPLCPCWVCFGNFDCIYYLCSSDIPQAVGRTLITNPTILFSRKDVATSLIRLYQTDVSAHTPPRCRFTPTCSNYGLEAIDRYGVRSGVWLTAKRLARCRTDVAWGTLDPIPLGRT